MAQAKVSHSYYAHAGSMKKARVYVSSSSEKLLLIGARARRFPPLFCETSDDVNYMDANRKSPKIDQKSPKP